MVLKLYYDFLSQPARAVYMFLKCAKIPFEAHEVNLLKGQHLSKEFKERYSKFGKVPFIHHDDFVLTESVAILRYLAKENSVADHWYPKNSKQQAKVDEYLEWHHGNLRLHSQIFFRTKYIIPFRTKQPPVEENVLSAKKSLIAALQDFERFFLNGDAFINGNEISFSDLQASCEIEQSKFGGYNIRDDFPRIKTWIEKVQNSTNPYYDTVHEMPNKDFENSKKQ